MAAVTRPINPPSTSSHVRPFNPRRDMGTVADLIERCFVGSLDADGERYLRQMREMAQTPGFLRLASLGAEMGGMPFIGYVWEQDGKIVGNVSLIPHRVGGRLEYLIANVAVDPNYRRQGIARGLTGQAIEHAAARGALELWLHAREDNDGAVTLYQNMDFKERARRTTWHTHREFPRSEPPPGIILGSRRAQHWADQKTWLEISYPPELSWHLPFKLSALQPGLWGGIRRLFNNQFVQQWSAMRGNELKGVVTWQSTSSHANALWLAAPSSCDSELISALLVHARRNVSAHRPLTLDYPARQHETAIQAAGFYQHQTLIWMRMEL